MALACAAGLLSALRREAEDDVEPGRQFADPRVLHRGEVHQYGVARLGVDGPEDAVLVVLRLALDVALRRQQLLAVALDLEMDVRRPAGIRDRLDRAEVVFAVGSGQEAAEALEILVVRL